MKVREEEGKGEEEGMDEEEAEKVGAERMKVREEEGMDEEEAEVEAEEEGVCSQTSTEDKVLRTPPGVSVSLVVYNHYV